MVGVQAIADVLEVVQALGFLALAVSATVIWFRRRGAARAWLAATFGVLGLITGVGLVLPDDPDAVPGILTVTLLALLASFPYLLFRFGGTFRRRPLPLEVVAGVIAAGVVGASFFLGDLPDPGDPWSRTTAIWVAVLLVQWVALSLIVAVELWQGGRGQPTVSRRRMRMLSVASIGLALVLVFSVSARSDDEQVRLADLVLQVLIIAAAPTFLLGFAPPQAVLAVWRRPELEELARAEAVLLQARSRAEVGEGLLPHVTRIIGGEASALFGDDGRLLGADGVGAEQATEVFDEAALRGELIALPVRAGRLAVRVSPYTPYFARSETELLSRLATFTDLALSRAELSEREREIAVELQAANEAMREFLAIASHDLRTPVTVIKGFASTLERDGDLLGDDQRRQFLGTIRRHADHLGAIIDDLLTTSRLDAGVLEPNPSAVSLAPFVERVVSDLRETLQANVEVPDDLVAWVDEEHLQRMLSNYLVNALRYGMAPVHVRATRTGDDVEVRVIDHGAGVPEEFEPRIFDKFARVDKRNSQDNQGTGLGLAIVRGLARAGGGDAWYERNQPNGACFAIRLPLAADGAASA